MKTCSIDTTYVITALTTLTNIIGFRLDAITDPTLPNNGPGRSSIGNFDLQELSVNIAPFQQTPTTWVTIGTPTISSTRGGLSFTGATNSIWTVQRAAGVQAGWTNIGSFLIAPNGAGFFQDTNPPPAAGYYRERQP